MPKRFEDTTQPTNPMIMSGANLAGARLQDLNLRGATVHDVCLKDASFTDVDLRGVVISDADIEGMIVDGIDISRALNIVRGLAKLKNDDSASGTIALAKDVVSGAHVATK